MFVHRDIEINIYLLFLLREAYFHYRMSGILDNFVTYKIKSISIMIIISITWDGFIFHFRNNPKFSSRNNNFFDVFITISNNKNHPLVTKV